MTRYRIFVADMGKFADCTKYEFVAEFADREIAAEYCKSMREDRRYRKKDIIAKELINVSDMDIREGMVCCIINVMGEYIPIDEIE